MAELTLFELGQAIKTSKVMLQKYSHITHVSEIDSSNRNSSLASAQGILSSYFTYLSPTWSTPSKFDFDREFSMKELIEIFKGAVFLEIEYGGQLLGSVSSVDRIYTVIAQEDYKTAKEMKKWIFDFGLGDYFSTHLVNSKHETLLASMFSEDPTEKQVAKNCMNSYQEGLKRKSDEYKKYCADTAKRTITYEIQQYRDIEGHKGGAREKFIEELNKLPLIKKLERLANDKRHSAKYYPTNIIYESTVEVLKNLDKELLRKLLERMHIPLRKSPWVSFRNRLYEATGTEQFHGTSKSFR
jgi:hypothetical protein